MNDWHQERQLYGSPYSGCRCFTGFPKPVLNPIRIPNNTNWPSPYNARGAAICCDHGRRHQGGAQNVQRVHFRGSGPVPSWVLGPGGNPIKPMPRLCPAPAGKPPYNLHALVFPSTSGPWNTRITHGISGNLPDAEICSIGQFSQHNLGWA